MEDINTIYHNDFGIAFQWKRCAAKDFNKVQLVFKNTGLFLNQEELLLFFKNIKQALNRMHLYNDCPENKTYELFLLEAPNPQISFAMCYHELHGIHDLVKRTIFQLGLDTLLAKQKVRYNY
ncbi:hypothetical protein Q4Q35_05615 [Flavivirga aquimarina]|uniref:Uncharacterized protein n=1 Tax=Flavivirga aquimarina TaxID=2027862 RepID=A0ABT8W878_9FLAO|nr:hypothetical protein [Flavivirga aquimarina]MDO5969279.1 hypothetical protein [Flavivirga aquimarina]